MANINLMLDDELKRDFKTQVVKNGKQISKTLRDFMFKFIRNPEAAIEFIKN